MDPQPSNIPTHDDIQRELEARRQAVDLQRQARTVPYLTVVIALLVLAIIGGAAYALTHTGRRADLPATTTDTPTVSQQTQTQPDTVTDTSSKQYVSNGHDLNLSFTYPASWKVQPPTNSNTSDEPIAVTSPLITMTGADGKPTTARAVVSIRPGGSALTELAGDKAATGQASVQIAYGKPTPAQHKYPYITFLHLAGGSNPGGAFEEIIITGSVTFGKGQAVYDVSLTQLDPIVSVRFYACADQACAPTNATPLSITNNTWQNDDTCQQVLAIFQSLQIS